MRVCVCACVFVFLTLERYFGPSTPSTIPVSVLMTHRKTTSVVTIYKACTDWKHTSKVIWPRNADACYDGVAPLFFFSGSLIWKLKTSLRQELFWRKNKYCYRMKTPMACIHDESHPTILTYFQRFWVKECLKSFRKSSISDEKKATSIS